MARFRRLVLDVLKPHEPDVPELAARVVDCEGVDGANLALVEIDRKVENVKLTVEGEDVDLAALREVIEGFGASVHFIDEVAAGDRVVEAGETPQD
ncbi:MAG: DUF211 domain-containing protein [Haloarculaceae archaeon]